MKTPKDTNVIGFPSDFAAFKWLDQNAVGPTCWRLNGHPGHGVYSPEPEFPLTLEQMAALSAWCLREQAFLENVLDAGCTLEEARFCMTTEAV
jgi:hypothetical protein